MCDYLIDAKRVSLSCADRANMSWVKLTSSAEFTSNAADFAKETDKEKSRLDYFFRTELGDRVKHHNLYEIIKMLLVLSPGNAEVERGFSINKNLIRDDLSEESLIAQRLVYQAVPTNGRKILVVEIDKQMIADVRMALLRRKQALEAKKLQKPWEQREIEERKLSAIQDLVAKRRKVVEEHKQVMKDIEGGLKVISVRH